MEADKIYAESGDGRSNGTPRKLIPSFEELQRSLPVYSPKRWRYETLSLFLRTVGTLSEGIKIGFKQGFDSGMIMNYIYENTPRGGLYIGKLLDKAFLNQITCKAFRAIKRILHNELVAYLEQRKDKPTYILDLASGKADYIYEVLKEKRYGNVEVLLRDISIAALEESEAIAENMGLANRVNFEQGDAFDVESLKKISPKPNLVVEVGLYGIIHDDDLVRRHFLDLKEILNPEAVIFNVQTYNPQIELIARALTNQNAERCVWRLRPVELLLQWAQEAGFQREKVVMDPYGIYAVVLLGNSVE